MKLMIVLFVGLAPLMAEEVVSILTARTGLHASGETYKFTEAYQVRGRWIAPDIGYIDFGNMRQYREYFVGAGGKTLVTKHLTIVQELYFVQALGSNSGNARYVQPWSGFYYNFGKKFVGEAALFEYVPLNKAGKKQFVLERAKLEYKINPLLKMGAGYGAYKFGNQKLQSKPFVTATVSPAKGKYGSFEFWWQKMPRGTQLQVRYEFIHAGKNKH